MNVRHVLLVLLALLVLAVALGAGIADVYQGQWDHDSGMFLLHASYMAEGLKPYFDYSTVYTPLAEMLAAVPMAMGLDRLALIFAIPIAWIVANTLASALLVLAVTRDRVAAMIVAALFALFCIQNGGNHLTLEHGVAFFSMLALVAATRPASARSLFLAGLFAAASFLCKQQGGAVFLPVAAILIERRRSLSRRDWIALVAGAALLPLLLLAWLHFDVSVILRNVTAGVGAWGSKPVPGWTLDLQRRPETIWLFAVALGTAIALVVRVAGLRLIAAAAAIAGVLGYLPRLFRNYPHYDINIWPFVAFLLALGIRQWPHVLRRFAIAYAVLVCAFVSYNRPRYPPLVTSTFAPAARIVAAVTPPHGVVRQYGTEPVIEFLAHRRQEQIDWGTSLLVNWNGGEPHRDPLRKGVTVVVVDQNDPWVPGVLDELRSHDFREVGAAGSVSPRVRVFR